MRRMQEENSKICKKGQELRCRYEKIFNYIKLIADVCRTNIFITVNIKHYLTSEQISELYKLAKYSKIHLILIEFNMCGDKYDCEKVYVIDKDNCIITF